MGILLVRGRGAGAPFQKWEKEEAKPVKFFENLEKKLRKC
jgi:hypothetical protein